jgi:hypothetical protein
MSKPKNVSAMGLIYDNLLNYDVEQTKRLTALYALIYDSIAISDSWLLTNPSVQAMLSTRDGVELVTQGIIKPLRRNSVGSYDEFHAQAASKKMHGLCATPGYIALLDSPAVAGHTDTFNFKQVAANYTSMSQEVLEPTVLAGFGISDEANAKIQARIRLAKTNGEMWNTNSFVKDVLCPLVEEKEAVLLMELARAPYNLNLPSVLGLGVVGPDDFSGDKVLAALGGNTTKVGSVDIKKSVAEAAFSNSISNPLITWLLSDGILQSLTSEELVICRSPEERRTYLEKLQIYLTSSSKEAWDQLILDLTKYLTKAAEDLFRYRAHKNNEIIEPAEGLITVEGSNSIRLHRPGKPVALTGVTFPTKSPEDLVLRVEDAVLSVIGRTINIPEFKN